MIKSMTGYGRSQKEALGKQFTVEVRSVNHRFLEIVIRQPRQYAILEDSIRKLIQQDVQRGRLEVFIKVEDLGQQIPTIQVDKEIALAYYNSLKDLADNLDISSQMDVFQLASLPEVLSLSELEEDLEQVWDVLHKIMQQAIEQLVVMRQREGNSLKQDLLKRIDILDELSVQMNQQSHLVVEQYRQKLQQRIQDLMQDHQIDEARLYQEVVFFADKSNITEEIIRLRSHFQQFRQALATDESVGRKLDFLVQEMNREINTIGSKANDLMIAKLVVEGKSELEKIREQVQNIE